MGLITISVIARKGGIGRTTSSVSLASAWAKEGLRCLVVDADPQASTTRTFWGSEKVESTHHAATLTAAFDARYDPEPEDIIHATAFENVSLVPSGDSLEDFNVTRPWETGEQQLAMRELLCEVRDRFDICLIDHGPSTGGLLAWSGLAASDFSLSPCLCDSFGTQSIISVQRLVEKVQTSVNPSLRILGYFINMRQRNAVMDAYEKTLRQVHDRMVFETVVPLAAAYRQAIAERTPIMFKKGNTKAHKIIRALADEIAERIIEATQRKEAA